MLQIYLTVLLHALLVWVPSWLVARWLTAWSIGWAEKRALLAQVNERSSHTTPTPRVGGIGLMGGVLVGFAWLAAMLLMPDRMPNTLAPLLGEERSFGWPEWAGWLAAALLAFGLGFWDDQSDPPALAKLLGQLIIAFLPPLAGLRLHELVFPGVVVPLHPAVGVLLSAAFILYVMNAVNFMDGINGLAGTFGKHVAGFAAVSVFLMAPWATVLVVGVAIAGGCRGFLRYNYPRAETFMGDCGSQPLGLMLAVLGLHISSMPTTYPLPILGFCVLLLPFLYDVAYTLLKRAKEGKNLLRAHREHLYQRYLRARGEDHIRTKRFVELHMWICGFAGAIYIAWFWSTEKPLGAWICLSVGAAAMVNYTAWVWWAERRATPAAAPPAPQSEQ